MKNRLKQRHKSKQGFLLTKASHHTSAASSSTKDMFNYFSFHSFTRFFLLIFHLTAHIKKRHCFAHTSIDKKVFFFSFFIKIYNNFFIPFINIFTLSVYRNSPENTRKKYKTSDNNNNFQFNTQHSSSF